MDLILIAIACGVIAVFYGVITSRQVRAASAVRTLARTEMFIPI